MTERTIRNILQELSAGAPLTPEFRLLLDCSLISPASQESAHGARAASLCRVTSDSAINWDVFTGLVDRHRVPALVCTVLNRYARDLVPGKIMTQIKERDGKSRREALDHAAELVRLGRLFAERGIESIPLKGPSLSMDLYGDPGLRQSRDLDLMVKPEDLDRADRLLLDEGYHRIFPDLDLSMKQMEALRSACQHYNYSHPHRSILLELHWRIDLWTPEQVAEMWSRSRPMEWSGAHFRRLDEEMLFLFLCDHGSHHQWFRIKWLSDVATMLSRTSAMDWTHLIETAGRLDLRRSLAQAALLVHWLYGMPLSEPLSALTVQEKKAVALARRSSKAMLMTAEDCNAPSFSDKWRREWYYLGLRTRLPYRYYLHHLFVDVETWKLFPLPDRAFRLYYLLRLPVWFRRYYM